MAPLLPKVAIIGAGSSGITALKTLAEQGFDVTCFEASDRIGGNWVYENKNEMSACYRDLHINTSRQRMAYSDYPMPADYPDYPRHDQIAAYFDDYVDHFGVRERIRFETKVEHAERGADGVWTLTLDGGEQERFDALVVANGHHWDPRWPEPAFPGSEDFQGIQMHAHAYMNPDFLHDKDVVVLGMGNSAMDIAVESSYVAANTYLAARRGAWILPKYLFGKPTDHLKNDPRIPFAIRQRAIQTLVRAYIGTPQQFGLPEPDHRFGEAHPTISGRILDRITHGAVQVKPNIARLDGDEVEFTDGTRVHADVVVYCTGYKITFPFFDEDFLSAPDNRIDLFRRVFHPDIPNVFFLGLLQPLGAVMPLAEAQGRWVADYLGGGYAPPSQVEMRRQIAEDLAAMQKRYVASKRHTIQVDFDDYLFHLARERRRGAERARERGNALPVPARAAAVQEAAA
ncbi:MAG: NAD(P)-binding domain-containing protein [Solirubrobacteraceae bacterium]|jgi:cation diffusion facilitator CzcD-associated flavoprotein CzcO|nr:NAD(P)-binding domain-containing protein [Solirubrobacteraceae bacterium]